MLRAILYSLLLFATASAFSLGDIKHFLVIFFENRSFNHIFGCAAAKGLLPGVDGLKAGMGNYKDPSDPSSGFIDALEQCGKAEYVCSHSPDHSFPGTQQQIFGGACDAACAADCATRGTCPNETMGGYAYNSRTHNYSSMHAFAPEQLPVKIALAQEFALFNNFYESMPGPSQPNHMFAQSATACGATETGVVYEQCGGVLPLFPQKTIYESLLDAGHDFRIFYNGSITEGGVPGDIYMGGLLKHLAGRAHTFDAKDSGFFDAAAKGTLPEFSWLLPRNGGPHPNDDHPCHDVALGEELLKSVYEALRAGPNWNDTALLVVYDDPGGFFDHVQPPLHAPPPNTPCDKKNSGCPDKFAFDRLGARLANLLISPRVPKGAVYRDPAGPTNTSKFDLASIPATVKNLFGLPHFLSERDAWSGSFHEAFTTPPRTDTPVHLPDAPPPTVGAATRHGCGAPADATRRQKRHHSLLSHLLHDEDDGDDDGEVEADDDGEEEDDDGAQIPGLGENSFLVTKGFDAMKSAIARKAERVLERLADGSLPVHADEL